MCRQSVDLEIEDVGGGVDAWEVDATPTVVLAFFVEEGPDKEVLLLSKKVRVCCAAVGTVFREDGVTIEVDFAEGIGAVAGELAQVYWPSLSFTQRGR